MTSNTNFVKYRNGSSGLIKWAEDNVWVPIFPIGDSFAKWWPSGDLPDTKHPETGRSYKDLCAEHTLKIVIPCIHRPWLDYVAFISKFGLTKAIIQV